MAHGKIKRAEIRTLMSGHTHEDVDSLFSNIASVLKQSGQRLHTPHDYLNVVRQYLNRDDVRPTEMHSEVVLLDQVRDWSHGLVCLELVVVLQLFLLPTVFC